MFWIKWICREVRGASPPWPSTWTMFWDKEEETAAVDRAAPGGHTACLLGKKLKRGRKNCSDSTTTALHWTCCHGGRSSLDGRVVAQLSLHAVGSTEARLWREEGGRGLAEGGLLLGRRGCGLAFAIVRLPITRAQLLGGAAGNREGVATVKVSTFLESHVSADSPAGGSSSLMGGVWKTDIGLKQRPAVATRGVPRGVFRWELAPE